MSFVTAAVGSLSGQTDIGSAPIQNILTSLFDGQHDDGTPQQKSGLGELLSGMSQAGLGDAVQSWIGSGTNHTIRPDQIQHAMGNDWIEQKAAAAGVDPGEFLTHLSQYLPHAIDTMTENHKA